MKKYAKPRIRDRSRVVEIDDKKYPADSLFIKVTTIINIVATSILAILALAISYNSDLEQGIFQKESNRKNDEEIFQSKQIVCLYLVRMIIDSSIIDADIKNIKKYIDYYNRFEKSCRDIKKPIPIELYDLAKNKNPNIAYPAAEIIKTVKPEQIKSNIEPRYKSRVNDLFSSAVDRYMNVVRDDAMVSLNKKNVEILEKNYTATSDLFTVGAATKEQVSQSEARLAIGRTQLALAEARLISSQEQYRKVTDGL